MSQNQSKRYSKKKVAEEKKVDRNLEKQFIKEQEEKIKYEKQEKQKVIQNGMKLLRESWTDDEEGKFVDLIKEKKSNEEMSVILKRTARSLECKKWNIMTKLFNTKKSLEDIGKYFNNTLEEITEDFNKQKEDMKKQKTIRDDQKIERKKMKEDVKKKVMEIRNNMKVMQDNDCSIICEIENEQEKEITKNKELSQIRDSESDIIFEIESEKVDKKEVIEMAEDVQPLQKRSIRSGIITEIESEQVDEGGTMKIINNESFLQAQNNSDYMIEINEKEDVMVAIKEIGIKERIIDLGKVIDQLNIMEKLEHSKSEIDEFKRKIDEEIKLMYLETELRLNKVRSERVTKNDIEIDDTSNFDQCLNH